jgi:tetratricopeptide (TPR) repeat protein
MDRSFDLIPHGIVSRATTSKDFKRILHESINPWPFYMTESFNSSFYRDYMTRTVTGYFFFKMGRDLILRGQEDLGARIMEKASTVAYNDRTLYGDMATFFIDMEMLEEAKKALEIFSENTTNRALLHNMWGYYYSKEGNVDEAIVSFKKSVQANPSLFDASRNLGLMYLEKGEDDLAKKAFEKSLLANPRQPNLIHLMKTKEM